MPTAFRITRAQYEDTAFTGEGSMRRAGRWHERGSLVVYAAATVSLALLESAVHTDMAELIAGDYVAFRLVFGESAVGEPSSLPDNWQRWPWPATTRRIGRRWLLQQTTPVLRVPSAVVPTEFNYLLNPHHPAFGDLEIGASEPLYVDPRLAASPSP